MKRNMEPVCGGKKQYECSICEKFFYTNDCLKQHNAAAHEEKKAHKCS